MVLNILGFLIVAFLAFVGYHVYKIAKKEQIRVDKQEAAYKRFLEDNAKAGNIFPYIDINGHMYLVKYNGQLLTLEEWETEPHQFSSYVSNHPYRHSKPPVPVDNQLNLFD